jgi:shikimate kinase
MKNIILIGFMGTGKTAVGKRLAASLGYRYMDTDVMIEERTGCTIADIFKNRGESFFREVESSVIQEIVRYKSSVISTGGGAAVDSNNLALLKENGLVICLKSSPEKIMERTERKKDERPLLSKKEPLKEIKRLLEIREPYYEQADWTVDTSKQSVAQVVAAIEKKLKAEKIGTRPG